MLTSGQQERKSKQRKIRNSEYYDMEGTFDRLYAESKKDKAFNHLMEIIESEENIKLAYRTIKKNTGSDTSGVDKRTIADLAKLSEEEYVRLIRKQFSNYHPRPVRRVEIPKPNGKTRPLGIPTIVDRIVQQCILQVMEPICEAKFSENSNGFRPNRSAETAIAQCMRLIQVQHLYHVVDLDIKGFFDNISHTKPMRQIWALGIRDKKLLCIIKEMLKAPVVLPNGEKTYPAPLIYLEKDEMMECVLCHKKELSKTRCEQGHYVCNECHTKGMDVIIDICLSETSKNPIEIIRKMMEQPFCHMHGPEHHVMVGSALLAAYKNAGGEIDLPEALLEMMNRGKAVPGGVCGFWGACGAGISTGMFISIISGATPLKNEPWGLANKMTSKALDAIGSIGGPRCCKRDSYMAIISAIDYVAENFNIQMEKLVIKCIHSDKNNQCIKERCPFHE